MPLGCTITIGARQVAGTLKERSRMRPSPALDSGADSLVSAGVVSASAPQNSDAVIDVTGPAVPLPGGPGSTRPRTRTSSRPSLTSARLPSLITHGAPPGRTPWNVG